MVKQKLLTALIVIAALMLAPSMAAATDCSKNDYYGCGTPLGDFLHKLFGATATSLSVSPGEEHLGSADQSGASLEVHRTNEHGFTLRAGIGATEVSCTGVTNCTIEDSHDMHFHVDSGYEFDVGPVDLSAFARVLHLEGGGWGYGTGAEVSLSQHAYVRGVWLHHLDDPNPQNGRVLVNEGDFHLYYGFRF